ncbi:MAG: pseudouridine synthase [Gammaproteobacteria bacterium]|nr:pseudouridine synthase [Gammaproteobacteria bacterium]
MFEPPETQVPEITIKVNPEDVGLLSDFLVNHTEIAKRRIKDAISKGAVWIKRGRSAPRRVRRANFMLRPNDQVSLFYDEAFLSRSIPRALCVADMKHYSVWFKPMGLGMEGGKYGDHLSLRRQVEVFFDPFREVHFVQSLDYRHSGLLVVAHSNSAATKLGVLAARHRIQTTYRILVEGEFSKDDQNGTIDTDIEGKPAKTSYCVQHYDHDRDVSTVEVKVNNLRESQFDIHFASIGHPVVDNLAPDGVVADTEGSMLGVELSFECPILKKDMMFALDEKHQYL